MAHLSMALDLARARCTSATSPPTCSSTRPTGGWDPRTIDGTLTIGEWSSIVVDHTGYGHISYYAERLGDLPYATNNPGGVIIPPDG